MPPLVIFGAKYVIALSIALAAYTIYRIPAERRREIVWLAGCALPFSYLSAILARALYFNPRPFVVDNIAPLIPHVPDNGFPSDHVLLAATLAAIVTVYDRKIGGALWILTIVIGASRMAAGIHHALDVIASMLIATITTILVYTMLRRFGRAS